MLENWSLRGGGRLQEVPNIAIWLGNCWYVETLVAEGRWSLTRGSKYCDLTWKLLVCWKTGRWGEVVPAGGSPVAGSARNGSNCIAWNEMKWNGELELPLKKGCGKLPAQPSPLRSLLRWLITVSSTFQDVDFDGSLLPLFITWCYNHGIKKLPNHWWTRWYHFRDTIGYHSNTMIC